MKEVVFNTPDSPTASGQLPAEGTDRYTVTMPLDNGDVLVVYMSLTGLENLHVLLRELMTDIAVEKMRDGEPDDID